MGAADFNLTRTQRVDALGLEVQAYTHPSGAVHYHLANDYTENVFMVALRTVPHDSTGVAHILEHTALCGSERFPVRDPFFMMIRRSLNTFMNAFTTSDYTAYPFASQNRKDYFNLMEVYLDAVFFSRLDPLDFAQEGHRLEFETPDDPTTPLTYRGVVYNEMKGDTSSPLSMLYHGIQEVLFPTSTYHYNSGGDPKHIPDLSYDALKNFYQTHYHPANAVFMTFGNISAEENQEIIASCALDRLDAQAGDIAPIAVSPEVRYEAPITSEFSYPVDDDDLEGSTHIVLGWLLGPNTDLEKLLKCHLLSDVLLDTAASPLRQALEKTDLAKGVSPMCGFEEDHMETTFMCGVEGSEPEHAEAIEALILEVLTKVAEEGVPVDRIEAVLHQLELSQREVGGDGMPFGLQLIFSCMSAAIHRGDPIGLLDLDPVIEKLREEIQEPDFMSALVQELLLDNPHRVRVVMKPDRHLGSRLVEEENARLAELKDALDEGSVQNIIQTAADLQARQASEENMELLPKVTREDVPAQRHFPEVSPGEAALGKGPGLRVTRCEAGTNGISYFQLINRLPALNESELGLLPLYSQAVTEIGSAGRGYLETQHLQHGLTGGISSFSTLRALPQNPEDCRAFLTFSSRTLNPKAESMVNLVRETALCPDFDEPERVTELMQQLLMRRKNGVASNGHQYAMSAAAAQLRPVAAMNDAMSGVPAITRLAALVSSLDEASGVDRLMSDLRGLQETLRKGELQALTIAEPGQLDELAKLVEATLREDYATGQSRLMPLIEPGDPQDQAFVVTTQVNYCASAYTTVPESHDDAAPLSVLAAVLRNGFLHTELREQGGAYGGGATHDAGNGLFRFYSYRDPRLMDTFESFLKGIEWIRSNSVSDAMLEEAVLQIISSIDAPGSPSGEIRQAFHHSLYDRSADYRRRMRARYLDVTAADLKRVAGDYFQTAPVRAVVTSENRLQEIDNAFAVQRVV